MTELFKTWAKANAACYTEEGSHWYNRIANGDEVYCYTSKRGILLSDEVINDPQWKLAE